MRISLVLLLQLLGDGTTIFAHADEGGRVGPGGSVRGTAAVVNYNNNFVGDNNIVSFQTFNGLDAYGILGGGYPSEQEKAQEILSEAEAQANLRTSSSVDAPVEQQQVPTDPPTESPAEIPVDMLGMNPSAESRVEDLDVNFDICYCSPSTFEFTLDFSLTCDNNTIGDTDGIENFYCFVAPAGIEQDISDFVPVSVSSIGILELDQTLVPFAFQPIRGTFMIHGDTFTYTSVTATDPNLPPERVPGGLQLNILGVNKLNQSIQKVYIITYTNDCEADQVFVEGQSVGWTILSDLLPPTPDYCPVEDATEPPTVPVELTSEPTKEPTISPTLSPTLSPSVQPTDSPTDAPSVSPTESPSRPPSPSPTVPPSASPTAEPSTVAPTMKSPTIAPTEATDSPTAGSGSGSSRGKCPKKKPEGKKCDESKQPDKCLYEQTCCCVGGEEECFHNYECSCGHTYGEDKIDVILQKNYDDGSDRRVWMCSPIVNDGMCNGEDECSSGKCKCDGSGSNSGSGSSGSGSSDSDEECDGIPSIVYENIEGLEDGWHNVALLSEEGEVVGSDSGHCVSIELQVLHCFPQFTFNGTVGTLTMQGVVDYDSDEHKLVVTGGTGCFKEATGAVMLTVEPENSKLLYDFEKLCLSGSESSSGSKSESGSSPSDDEKKKRDMSFQGLP